MILSQMEMQQYYFLVIILIILQSIVGIGVLVVGTPLLLLLNFEIIEIMFFLLPISILTSFINFFLIKIFNKNKLKFYLDSNIKKYFFIYCLPGIFLGIYLIKNFQAFINFELLVASIILISLLIKYKYENLFKDLSDIYSKIILTLIGVIHGLSNSGGTLLSLFLISSSEDKKNQLRYKISFYYFFLALLQYLILSYIFQQFISLDQIIYILPLIFIGSMLGNFLCKIIDESFFKKSVQFIAFLSSIILIIKKMFLV